MDKFLVDLLESRSPTGSETEAANVIEKYVKPLADTFEKDVLGNRIASYGNGKKTLMLAGHIDEIGLQVSYIDNDGFLFFQQLGGHDNVMISGRAVCILTDNGIVRGVTGKRAIHLMDAKERKEVPETHQIWIDIGASNKKEAEKLVSIGDAIVYETSIVKMSNNCYASRAFDDKAGAYAIFETLRRLAKAKVKNDYKLVSVGTTQEEIGTRGAWTSSYAVNADVAIAVDVTHATDFPTCDVRKFGSIKLGEGVVISRGPNLNPKVSSRLIELAKKNKIPYQIEAEPRPTGTDARVIQTTRGGVPTGLLSIPLRYMHTPCEVANTNDIKACVDLLEAFAKSLKNKDDFTF